MVMVYGSEKEYLAIMVHGSRQYWFRVQGSGLMVNG